MELKGSNSKDFIPHVKFREFLNLSLDLILHGA